MPCQILVANKCSVPRSEIILIEGGSHIWGAMETMSSWISSGRNKDDWKRDFSLVIVTDKEKEDLMHLLDTIENGENKYHFAEPDPTSPLYQTLYASGEVSAPWSVVSQFIVSR